MGRAVKIWFITVTVPPNSMATLYLLSESILEPEKIAKMEWGKKYRILEFLTKIILESGNYTFNIH
jgi:hypothetical protein